MENIQKLLVSFDGTVYNAIEAIQQGHEGIALIVDANQKLLATITDGDIRRATLDKVQINDSIADLLHYRSADLKVPITAHVGISKSALLSLMKEKVVRHIPLLDDEGRVVELALLRELMKDIQMPLSAVIMAGGRGKRLLPLTENTPKPMLPLQGRPFMERTIGQLKKANIDNICITTHHKPEVITDYFGDGSEFGVNIGYVNEDTPLGTAGALGLLESAQHTSLVINGDIMTQLDFRSMLDFHHSHDAIMTVGIRKFGFEIPYGVVETEGVNITSLVEKPTKSVFVNAGVYLLEPAAFQQIPSGVHFDMTDLIQSLLDEGGRVIAFPIQEYWLDIGQPDDYEQAIKDVESGKV
jgi:dTDP-glucose pyrophosphorylase